MDTTCPVCQSGFEDIVVLKPAVDVVSINEHGEEVDFLATEPVSGDGQHQCRACGTKLEVEDNQFVVVHEDKENCPECGERSVTFMYDSVASRDIVDYEMQDEQTMIIKEVEEDVDHKRVDEPVWRTAMCEGCGATFNVVEDYHDE